ncbi:MAG: hypothetical protein ACRDJW_19065 [Thermomicrobiales bacterium]
MHLDLLRVSTDPFDWSDPSDPPDSPDPPDPPDQIPGVKTPG